jgi:hypothetical protein
MALPDFFVLGAPKAGTTALHAALDRHPQIHMSAVKEPKFFLCHGEPPRHNGPGDRHSDREWIWRRSDYESLFDDAPTSARKGESTPLYLADPAAHRAIHELVPRAQMIVIVRDPVDRAYSNWAHLWSDGLEPVGNFLEACKLEEERMAAGWAPFWQYLSLGRYGEQLQHLHTLFPRPTVHVVRYRDLVDVPSETLDGICRFLGVQSGVVTEVPTANVGTYVDPSPLTGALQATVRGGARLGSLLPPRVWRTTSEPLRRAIQRQPRHRPELAREDRAQLVGYFASDVALLEELTGLSLGEWLAHRSGGTYSVRRSWAPSRRAAS